MDTPSPSMRKLARRLLAASRSASGPHGQEAVLMCETLRMSLTRFAGADGSASLFRRALALAGAEAPSLQGVTLTPDGCPDGLEKADADAAVALAAHLLGLLVVFIGEPLTLRLLREAWPDAPLDNKR